MDTKKQGRPKTTTGTEGNSYGVYLSREQQERVNILAFLLKTTRSQIIRDLIDEKLNKHKQEIDKIIEFRDSL